MPGCRLVTRHISVSLTSQKNWPGAREELVKRVRQLHNGLRTMCRKCLDDYSDFFFFLCQNILIFFGLLDAGTGNHKTAV